MNDFNVNQCSFSISCLHSPFVHNLHYKISISAIKLDFYILLKRNLTSTSFFFHETKHSQGTKKKYIFVLLAFSASYHMRYCHLIYISLNFDIGFKMEFDRTVKFPTLKTSFNNLYINKYFLSLFSIIFFILIFFARLQT